MGTHQMSHPKDCLVLNVLTPSSIASEQGKLPVVFFIHGGGGVHFSAHAEWETGEELVRREEVVTSRTPLP